MNVFCSMPEWFSLIRRIAWARSSWVKNFAFTGLSGKKNQTMTPKITVRRLVITRDMLDREMAKAFD